MQRLITAGTRQNNIYVAFSLLVIIIIIQIDWIIVNTPFLKFILWLVNAAVKNVYLLRPQHKDVGYTSSFK